ncbi:MAG: ABC transporter substrate-binding protein [Candidatus Lustribacter sp.]|jgi:branched-chain amino acid transport system substrate-binding protein
MLIRRAFATLLLVFSLVAPAGSQPAPVRIDVIISLTGSTSFTAKDQVDTLHVLEAYTNKTGGIDGRPVQFVVHDDASSPQVAVQLANQIIAAKGQVILGPAVTGPCQAVAAIVVDKGPVSYCLSPPIAPPANSYVFAASMPAQVADGSMLKYLRLRGFRRFAFVVSTDASGQTNEKAADAALALPENSAVRVVDREYFAPTDVSIAAQAAKIKASDADVVVVWCIGTPFGTVLRGLKDANVTLPVMTTGGNYSPVQLAQYVSFLPKDLYLPGYPFLVPQLIDSPPHKAAIKTFLDLFHAAGITPSPGAAPYVWDPAMMVIAGLRKLGPDATATQLRDYLLSIRSFVGINGRYDFSSGDQHGLTAESQVIVRWDAARGAGIPVSRPGAIPLPGL